MTKIVSDYLNKQIEDACAQNQDEIATAIASAISKAKSTDEAIAAASTIAISFASKISALFVVELLMQMGLFEADEYQLAKKNLHIIDKGED